MCGTEAYGIASFAKCFCWIATRPDWVAVWSQAGVTSSLEAGGTWWAATAQQDWLCDAEWHRRPNAWLRLPDLLVSWNDEIDDKVDDKQSVAEDEGEPQPAGVAGAPTASMR